MFERISLLGLLAFSGIAFAEMDTQKGPCRADVEKFCSSLKPGGGTILRCLKEHEKELSTGCADNFKVLSKVREENREKMKAAISDLKAKKAAAADKK